MRGNAQAVSAAVLSSTGAFLFGLDIGYIAPILECAPFKRDVARLPNWRDPASAIPGAQVGLMVGFFSIGCIITAFPPVSSHFLDAWGRRSSIIAGGLVFLSGTAIQALAMSTTTMLLGRLTTGCSIGLLSTVVPLYQAEMAPQSLRGGLTSLYQVMITWGILVAAFLDMFLVKREGGWRIAIWLQAVPALALILGMSAMPESPRWLMQHGRSEEARQVLESLRGGVQEAADELSEIRTNLDAAKKLGEPRWAEIFTGRVGRLTAVGFTLQMLQQLCGMNAFMYYGPRIFRSFGFQENLFQTINNAVNCAATLPVVLLADRLGRRRLMYWSAAGMTIACVVMGVTGNVAMKFNGTTYVPTSNAAAIVMAAMVFFFVISFAMGWGPIVWVYCAEIFPMKYRGRCLGVTTTTNWVGNYIIAQFAPMLLEVIGYSTFFVFGAFAFMGLLLSLWLPETQGVLLEHTERLFDEKFGLTRKAEGPAGAAPSYGSA